MHIGWIPQQLTVTGHDDWREEVLDGPWGCVWIWYSVIAVKESISIHDSADLVGKTASSFPNIIPTAIAETKSTSTSVMES